MGNPLSKTSRKVKDSILKRVGKAAVALVAATATLASGVITTGSALAATTDGPGYWFNATRSGSWWLVLTVVLLVRNVMRTVIRCTVLRPVNLLLIPVLGIRLRM